jgi:hypothetical protein
MMIWKDKKRYNNIRYKQYKTQQQVDKTINFIENNIKNNTIYIYTTRFSIFSPYFFCVLKNENNDYITLAIPPKVCYYPFKIRDNRFVTLQYLSKIIFGTEIALCKTHNLG